MFIVLPIKMEHKNNTNIESIVPLNKFTLIIEINAGAS